MIFSDVFDCYEKIFEPRKFKFLDVFAAIEVFRELNLITLSTSPCFKITPVRDVKRNLTDSKIYNKLSLIKNIFKEK